MTPFSSLRGGFQRGPPPGSVYRSSAHDTLTFVAFYAHSDPGGLPPDHPSSRWQFLRGRATGSGLKLAHRRNRPHGLGISLPNLLLLTHKRVFPSSLGQLTSAGIRPDLQKILAAKGTIAPRAAYEPIAAQIIAVDSGGVTAVNPRRFTFRLARPEVRF